jgi:hypothetical protein
MEPSRTRALSGRSSRRGIRRTVVLCAVGLLVLAPGAITATIGWRPILGPASRPLTGRVFEPTPLRLERGRYLAEGVTGCLYCHSELDARQPGLPPRAGHEGAGRVWAAEGMPWLVAPNLTPDPETGAGLWSDDAFARAIREGIGHDGRALFPLMPYERFRSLSDEDLASVVVYIRSLPPIRHALPATALPFPLNRLVNAAPTPLPGPVPAPDRGTPAARGAYLATIGACADCHTPKDDRGRSIAGLDFAGGFRIQDANGAAFSANLTPDPSGIPYYDDALFLETMRTGQVKARGLRSVMPWASYRRMADDDLKALFAFLRSVPPVRHAVDNSLPPTHCRLCGADHGGGERN